MNKEAKRTGNAGATINEGINKEVKRTGNVGAIISEVVFTWQNEQGLRGLSSVKLYLYGNYFTLLDFFTWAKRRGNVGATISKVVTTWRSVHGLQGTPMVNL
ncbi:hypothetical protein PoB_006913500 [Plakobranchus ocellatus]|uniref:Uncharacterized protein n=1 Tax=Plakobranchus ocellatus TaxID=259542 RepID=A0AAV4DF55_9GAST|nr:hypothetical protein PoB_006913500 [Plakobranchus ocellatus]